MASMDKVLMNAITNVEEKVDAITAGGSDSSSGVVLAHTHKIADITTLQTNLDTINTDITTLQNNITTINTSLASKANSTHKHKISDITELQTNLDTINTEITTLKKSDNTSNPFKGKWVSILGDSISTYKGFNPEGQAYTEQDDLTDVTKTWWGYLLTKLGAKLCVNNSENGIACCGSEGAVSKGRHKLLHRVAGSTYPNLDGSKTKAAETIKPDIILVFLGHNDFNSGNKAFGTYDIRHPHSWGYSNTSTVCNAFESLMCNLIETYPDATVYIMNPIYVGAEDKTKWPLPANTADVSSSDDYWCQPMMADMIRTFTLKWGYHYIETNRLGIIPTTTHSGTDKFLYSGFSHPTAVGHKIIAHKVLSSMLSDYAGWSVRNEI